jgi:hypothetical protein
MPAAEDQRPRAVESIEFLETLGGGHDKYRQHEHRQRRSVRHDKPGRAPRLVWLGEPVRQKKAAQIIFRAANRLRMAVVRNGAN